MRELEMDDSTPKVNEVIGFTAPELMLWKMTELAKDLELLLTEERRITGEQGDIIEGLRLDNNTLKTLTQKLAIENLRVREANEEKQREIISLKQELTHLRPALENHKILHNTCCPGPFCPVCDPRKV